MAAKSPALHCASATHSEHSNDDLGLPIAHRKRKRRDSSLQARKLHQLFASGGPLDSQTTDSQWYDRVVEPRAPAGLETDGLDVLEWEGKDTDGETSLDGHKGAELSLAALEAGPGSAETGLCAEQHSLSALVLRTHATILPARMGVSERCPHCSTCAERTGAALAGPPSKHNVGIQTTPYAGCSRDELMARLFKLQQGPHFDENGDEYVPASDCEGETNYELRLPSPGPSFLNGRRPPLRLTRPTALFPGTHKLFWELARRPEHEHLDPAGSLLDRTLLQEAARKEYLQRVLDGYESEPTDRELVYLMRPYSLCSIHAK